MATLYLSQIGSALEAELAYANKRIKELEEKVILLKTQRDQIKLKWEDLAEQLEMVNIQQDKLP